MGQKPTSSNDSGSLIFEIPMKMPNLNDYIKLCRGNKYSAAILKSSVESDIFYYIMKLPKIDYPVTIEFLWVEKDARRDPDNIAFAKKFILDALVKFGKLKNDGQAEIKGLKDDFAVAEDYKVIVKIKEWKNGKNDRS